MQVKITDVLSARPGVYIQALALSASLSGPVAMAGTATFHRQCPDHGTGEIIIDPAQWADNCYMAYTGRLPAHIPVERRSIYRDVDLDGIDEILELRGHGTGAVPIYVFKKERDQTYRYIGKLHAAPDFKVQRNPQTGLITIEYVHRYGMNDSRRTIIRYIDNEFRVIETKPVSGHN